MSWKTAKISEYLTEKELRSFLREIHARNRFGSFTWDAPNVPANSTVDTTLTSATVPVLSGMRAGMPVSVSPPAGVDAGLMWGARVDADDSLTIRLANVTGSGIDEASGVWSFKGVII